MNFVDERFVRLFTRDTINWRRMGWQARCTLVMLMRRVDRAGLREYGEGWTYEDVAVDLDLPTEIVAVGLEKLIAIGTVTRSHLPSPGVTIPNFLEAQEVRQSDAARQRASRETRRARAVQVRGATDVTSGHQASQPVTNGHHLSLPPPSLHTSPSGISKECAKCGKKTSAMVLHEGQSLCLDCRLPNLRGQEAG